MSCALRQARSLPSYGVQPLMPGRPLHCKFWSIAVGSALLRFKVGTLFAEKNAGIAEWKLKASL